MMLKNVPTGQFTEMRKFAFLDIFELNNVILPQDLFCVMDPGLQRNSSSEKVRFLAIRKSLPIMMSKRKEFMNVSMDLGIPNLVQTK